MDTWLIFVAICVLLLCLIATIFVLIVYSGTLERIEVKAGNPPIGKVVIAYKFARGPYTEAGPLFFEVAKIAPDHKALAIYYDDSNQVESQHMRYVVACILAEGEEETVDKELVKKFEAEGFKISTLPSVEYAVHSSFPYKSALSIFIGMQKVFPRMSEYIQEHGLQAHPFLEIYSGNTIYYMAPLDKHDEFYVPESLQKTSEEKTYESVSSMDQEGNISVKGSPQESNIDRPETESLLHPSQIVRAEVIGSAAEAEKMAREEMEKGAEAEGREGSPEFDSSSCITEDSKKEEASDEESGSSFEELKMEPGEDVCEKSQPQ